VNDPKFCLDWMRYMNMVDLVELFSPIGLQNKNAIDIIKLSGTCTAIFSLDS